MPHGCAALFLFLLIWKAKPLNKTVFTGNDMLFYKNIFVRSGRLYRQSERRALPCVLPFFTALQSRLKRASCPRSTAALSGLF